MLEVLVIEISTAYSLRVVSRAKKSQLLWSLTLMKCWFANGKRRNAFLRNWIRESMHAQMRNGAKEEKPRNIRSAPVIEHFGQNSWCSQRATPVDQEGWWFPLDMLRGWSFSVQQKARSLKPGCWPQEAWLIRNNCWSSDRLFECTICLLLNYLKLQSEKRLTIHEHAAIGRTKLVINRLVIVSLVFSPILPRNYFSF